MAFLHGLYELSRPRQDDPLANPLPEHADGGLVDEFHAGQIENHPWGLRLSVDLLFEYGRRLFDGG